jgi:hypothetical protein
MGTTKEKKTMEQPSNQLYERFQQYSNHPVVESHAFSSHKGKEMPSFLCGPPRLDEHKLNPKGLNYIKNSANEFNFESSNRIHRLSNLLQALKE